MRTETHIIDTKAVKAVVAALPDYWVVRELTERDYGIDLMVEIFAPGLKDANEKEAYDSTGAIFHIQIKGTNKPLEPVTAGTINYCIGKKSLAYVEKFSIPFFLFRVSVAEPQKIYFLWIQRYIKDVMDRETPMWREEDENSITVRMPSENVLPAGFEKIEGIAFRPKYLEELAEFSEIFQDIGSRINAIRAGDHEVDDEIIADLRSRALRARRLSVLLSRNECCINRQSVDELVQYITDLDTKAGRRLSVPHAQNFEMLAQSMSGMDLVENFVLENDGQLAY